MKSEEMWPNFISLQRKLNFTEKILCPQTPGQKY